MKVIGLDPGSRKTGYGIVEHLGTKTRYIASGCIRLGEDLPLAERLLILSEQLEKILEEYQPDCGAVESVFFGKNAKSALVLGHARGVILLRLAACHLPISEYAPLDVKKSIVGVGRATKEQVQQMVKILLNRRQQTLQEDEADALAVAITHSHFIPFLKRRNDYLS